MLFLIATTLQLSIFEALLTYSTALLTSVVNVPHSVYSRIALPIGLSFKSFRFFLLTQSITDDTDVLVQTLANELVYDSYCRMFFFLLYRLLSISGEPC